MSEKPEKSEDHPPSEDCPCGPEIRPVVHEDGTIDWLIIHRA